MLRRIFQKLFGGSVSVPEFRLPAEDELERTSSGLGLSHVEEGAGRSPSASNEVTVHYAGWLTSGKLFDSSYGRGRTIRFPLGGVIRGWTEGLQLMKEGGTAILVIPPALAYGARGAPPAIGPNETLVFRVELVQVH